MRAPLVLASLFLGLCPGAARAADSVCWIQSGVLLVPAVAGGVNGVFILDTGAAQSQLDATQASEANLGDTAAVGEVRFAGRTFPNVRMQVLELDARTRAFPTPIAGVLGSDILAGQVLQIEPNPCRVRLTPAGRRPRRAGDIVLPITFRDGAPYVHASVSDGIRGAAGDFRIDTGGALAVTLPAGGPATEAGRLRALAVGGVLFENVPAGAPKDAAQGRIGEPIWARFAMRLDYAKRRLTLSNPRP